MPKKQSTARQVPQAGRALIATLCLFLTPFGCGPAEEGAQNNGAENNGSSNNGANNGVANNGSTNNGSAGVDLDPVDSAPGGSWPSFRMDPQRTGHNPAATTGATLVGEVWRLPGINTTDYGAAKGSASVWGDDLYIGTDDARFFAIDRTNGNVKWQAEITDTTQGIHGTPTIGPDLVYVGAYNGTVHAYDRQTGEERWAYDKGFQIGSSPVLVPEHGRVYTAHEDSETGGGWVTSIDARTGEPYWEYRIRAHAHSSVALDLKNDRVFVGDNLAILHAFDTWTGDKVWAAQLDQTPEDQSDIKTTPTVVEAHDLVVAGAWSRKVHAWDVHTGEIAWEYDTGGARIMGSTAYAPGRDAVYVGSLSPVYAVHAIDAETGAELWVHSIGASVMSSPAVNSDESLIVVGANDGNLYALDAETGDEVWRHEIGGRVSSSPTLVGSMVYVAAANGDLVALETE